MASTADLAAGPTRSSASLEREIEAHRRELTGYCYRMLGSGFEAEDAVQETMLRAWRGVDRFEGRSALRSWLYRIAHNVCLDLLDGRQRRALPMDLGPASPSDSLLRAPLPEHTWVQPVADDRVVPDHADPAERAAARESIRLAFVAALQHLPPRQRAVLILREVLRWQASEVAHLLDTTVVSVNSSLQRARATLARFDLTAVDQAPEDPAQAALLARYVDAFERYDITALVALLHEDASFTMPPHDLWLQGPAEVHGWMLGHGAGCRGSRLLATSANGCAAFGTYRVDPRGGHAPFALQVVEVDGDRIAAVHNFLEPGRFAAFGLPAHLPA